MRHPERIKIVIKTLKKHGLGKYLHTQAIFSSEMEAHEYAKTVNLDKLAAEWKKHPDMRLTQMLITFFGLPNFPGFWFYKEEDEELINKGMIEARDILFWGSNYTKKGKKREETVWKPIRNLDTDHIKAIFKWYETGPGAGANGLFLAGKMSKFLALELKLRENVKST